MLHFGPYVAESSTTLVLCQTVGYQFVFVRLIVHHCLQPRDHPFSFFQVLKRKLRAWHFDNLFHFIRSLDSLRDPHASLFLNILLKFKRLLLLFNRLGNNGGFVDGLHKLVKFRLVVLQKFRQFLPQLGVVRLRRHFFFVAHPDAPELPLEQDHIFKLVCTYQILFACIHVLGEVLNLSQYLVLARLRRLFVDDHSR